jgi:hypothetical protein
MKSGKRWKKVEKAPCLVWASWLCVRTYTLCRNPQRLNRFRWRWSKQDARELVLLPPLSTPLNGFATHAPSPRARPKASTLICCWNMIQNVLRNFSRFSEKISNLSETFIWDIYLNFFEKFLRNFTIFSQKLLKLSQFFSDFWQLSLLPVQDGVSYPSTVDASSLKIIFWSVDRWWFGIYLRD